MTGVVQSFADPLALALNPRGARRLVAPAISLAVLAAAVVQLDRLDLRQVAAVVPHTAWFWLAFAVTYMIPVAAEWLIYRRLWSIPLRGMVALLRQSIGSEVLLGYIGEVYFYHWARRHRALVAAPFGAIKDVTILSALVGNGVTLLMIGLAWPYFGALNLGHEARPLLIGLVILLASSIAAIIWRHRLFTLPHPDLRSITLVHMARIIGYNFGLALLWHLALPELGLHWWLLMAALRLLVSRLPFVPNKDIVFAGLVVFLIGSAAGIDDAVAAIASLMLAAHLLLGLVVMAVDLRRRPAGADALDTPVAA